MTALLRAFVVDDEPLAVRRLERLLLATGRVAVIGSATDPVLALEALAEVAIDVLFLDVQMPEMNGFELLAALPEEPPVVFTTAHDRYALEAFAVTSIDYLLKPIDPAHLDRAIAKLERLRAAPRAERLAELLGHRGGVYPTRIASRIGSRARILEVADISHFLSEDKLTSAIIDGTAYVVDDAIVALERKLDPARFVRVSRAALVNLSFVAELRGSVAGGLRVCLRDSAKTELVVARRSAVILKQRLGI
ncbi:MAG TPA: LytTR family DNA-binding domain-containing protein [Kofleriaceae bacterium]|nr:LytTR family DNA-binding domain-containing protein [Kofleriaceae bacterium]